jgi:hypothetical protein
MKSFQRSAIASLIVTSLAACGGGGGGGGSSTVSSNNSNQSPGGIWTSQYTVTAGPNTGDMIKAVAIVSENGDLYFAARNQNNGCAEVGFGQASVTGNSISGNVDVAIVQYTTTPGVNTTCAYQDGSTSGMGTISGTVAQRSSMTLSVSGTTSMGMALGSETETWTFSSSYDTASSLATVAGNYNDGGDTLSIDGNGVIFEQDPATGCVTNGQISPIDTQYNAYSISLTPSNCTGGAAVINGVTFTGLATLDQTVSPSQLDFGVSASINGSFAVVVAEVTHQ